MPDTGEGTISTDQPLMKIVHSKSGLGQRLPTGPWLFTMYIKGHNVANKIRLYYIYPVMQI